MNMDEAAINNTSETPSVVYATLVTLGGAHDGGDQEGQLVAVSAQDLVGQEVNLANFSGLTGHSNVNVSEALQAVQQFQVFQTASNEEGSALLDTTSAVTVQPLDNRKDTEEVIEPPIPKGPYTCSLCSKVFAKWGQLRRHEKSHDDDQPFRCNICSVGFNIQENMTLHEAIHKEPPVCPECGKTFNRMASLKAHIILHERDECLMCPECGDEFAIKSQLDRHIADHRKEQDGLFECKNCQLEFSSRRALKSHMQEHVQVRPSLKQNQPKKANEKHGHYKCNYCLKRFIKPSQLQRHMRIHTGERPYHCQTCKKKFNQKGALQLHLKTHQELRPFKCDHCPMRFAQKGNLKAHVARTHENKSNEFKCTECSCSFKKLGALNAHISRLHTTTTDAVQASAIALASGGSTNPPSTSALQSSAIDSIVQQILAGVTMSAKETEAKKRELNKNLSEALAADSNMNTDILAQALANSGLETAGEEDTQLLRERLMAAITQAVSNTNPAEETEHGTRVILSDSVYGLKKTLHTVRKVGGIRWHQCQYCTKEFKKPSDLVRHIRTHTHEKPYKCEQCFRTFSVSSTLKAHMRTHTGVKGYKCDICEKMFATHGSLKIHMRLHTGDKPFVCPLCNKSFRTTGHLKSHQVAHFKTPDRSHRGLTDRMSKNDITLPDIALQEPIVITDDGLVQQPPRHSQMYQQITGEDVSDRPHKCNFCHHSFKKSSHLRQHIRSHTGEKPYECVSCNRSFVSSGVLKAHMKTHSGVKNYKCDECQTSFTTNGSLKRHLSTHSEVRPYMCPYCQKTFKTSVNCKKHMKTHKPELVMALQSHEVGGAVDASTLQALQATQPHTSIHTHDQQVSNLLSSVNQSHDGGLGAATAGLMTGVNQQYLTTGNDDMDEARTDTIIQDGQFALNTQFVSAQNLTFADGQGLSQNFIGSNQQSLNQLNYNQQYTIDLASLGSTNISNILQPHSTATIVKTGEGTVTIAVDQPAVTFEGQDGTNEEVNHPTQVVDDMNPPRDEEHTQLVNETHPVSLVEPPQPDVPPSNGVGNPSEVPPEEPPAPPSVEAQGDNTIGQVGSELAELENSKEVEDEDYVPSEGEEDEDDEEDGAIGLIDTEKEAEPRPPPKPQEMGVGKRRYDCNQCGETFNKASLLREHTRIHNAERLFRCASCNKAFVTQIALNKHKKKTHQGTKEFMCQLCDRAFANQSSLSRHLVSHTSFKPLGPCKYCNTQFQNAAERDAHTCLAKVHAETSVQPQPEEESLFHFVHADGNPAGTTAVMVTPDLLGTGKSIKPISVKTATQIAAEAAAEQTNRSVSLKMLEEATADNERISEIVDREKMNAKLATLPKHANQCTQCPRSFKKPSDLLRHLRIHTGEKPFHCDKCGKKFTVKSTLISHLKTHKGHEKVYHCHICGSPFATKGTLKVHMRIHTGAKPFTCPHCDSRFRTSGHRKSHMMSHFKNHASDRRVRKAPTKTVTQTTTAGVSSTSEQVQQTAATTTSVGDPQQYINLDGSLLAGGGVLSLDPVIQIGVDGTQAILPSLDGIQLQLTNTINGQPGLQITGLDPSLIGQPLPLQIDNNILAQLQQSGNINITFNANTSGLAGQGVSLTDPNLIQIPGEADLLQASGQDAGQQIIGETPESLLNQINQEAEQTDMTSQQMSTDTVNTESSLPSRSGAQHIVIEDITSAAVAGVVGDEESLTEGYSDNSLVCQICGKVTKDENDLAEHLLAHDDNAAHARVKRIHKCPDCGKLFDKPSQLGRHMRIHTGERPYVCELCCKSFSQKNTLQVHMTKHTGARPYQCPVCDTKFTQKGNMKTHIKRAHPDETIVHNIEALNQDEIQVAANSQEALPTTDDVIAAAASSMDPEPDDSNYDLQLYNIQDAM